MRERFRDPVVDGRPAGGPPVRWRRRVQRLLVSNGERQEAELERLLGSQPSVSRANVVVVISPKGGVGKTTSAFVVGGLLADRLRLRVIAVDANPGFAGARAVALPTLARRSAHGHRANRDGRAPALLRVRPPEWTAPARRSR